MHRVVQRRITTIRIVSVEIRWEIDPQPIPNEVIDLESAIPEVQTVEVTTGERQPSQDRLPLKSHTKSPPNTADKQERESSVEQQSADLPAL